MIGEIAKEEGIMNGFLVFIAVIGFIYGLVAIIVNSFKKSHLPGGPLILVASLILIGVAQIFVVIGAQEVGVLITPSGVAPQPLKTGWHFVGPWNKVERMDKTVWVYTFSHKQDEGQKRTGDDAIWTPTRDGIKMGLDVSISWGIDPEYAPWIYSNISENDGGNTGRYFWIEENFIRAKTKSVIALTVSNYSPIEVYSNKRQEIQDEAFKKLEAELATYHIVLKQIDIREVFYNSEYEQAINSKKLAEQEVLRLIEVTKQKQEQLKQAEIDKNIKIQQAEGEARALQIKGQSISANPKIVQLEWIDKWDGKLPQYMMGDDQGIIVNLNK